MKLLFLVLVVLVFPLAIAHAQNAEPLPPPTVKVAPKLLLASFLGRTAPQITRGWPATLRIQLFAKLNPESLRVTVVDTAGKTVVFPWKTKVVAMATGSARYLTLAQADTSALAAGKYLLGVECSNGRTTSRVSVDFTVADEPVPPPEAEKAGNLLAYCRATGDYAGALAASARALALQPDDVAKKMDHAQALLDAGQPEAALKIGRALLKTIPKDAEEPPEDILNLVNDARGRLIDQEMAKLPPAQK